MLETRRGELRSAMSEIICGGAKGECDCRWGRSRAKAFQRLHENEHSPAAISMFSLSTVIHNITNAAHENGMQKRCPINGTNHVPREVANGFQKAIVKALKQRALCLECIEASGAGNPQYCSLHRPTY